MRKFDKLAYAIHKWCGLIGGVFILFLSVTGTLLVFRDEIDRAFNAALNVTPAENRLPYDRLIANIKQQYPNAQLNGTFLYNGTTNRAILTEIQEDHKRTWVYSNPYTGAITGARVRNEIFIVKLLQWHEHLTIGETGHLILFFVGLCLFTSVLTGVWYYRKSLLSVFSVGIRRRTSYLLNADTHKLVGVSACLFLFLMSGTGTFMHWEKVERMFGEEDKKQTIQAPTPQPNKAPTDTTQKSYSIDLALAKASAAVSGFVPQYVGYPSQDNEALMIRGTRPESNRMLGKFNTSVMVNPDGSTGLIKHKEDADLEANLESRMEQLHFGEYGGLLTKIIHGLGGIGLGVLTITGFLIWWKKR